MDKTVQSFYTSLEKYEITKLRYIRDHASAEALFRRFVLLMKTNIQLHHRDGKLNLPAAKKLTKSLKHLTSAFQEVLDPNRSL